MVVSAFSDLVTILHGKINRDSLRVQGINSKAMRYIHVRDGALYIDPRLLEPIIGIDKVFDVTTGLPKVTVSEMRRIHPATMQGLHDALYGDPKKLIVSGVTYPCRVCDTTFVTEHGLENHQCKGKEQDMQNAVIPTHPSNRNLINQMIAWGWVVGKRVSNKVKMRWPATGDTVSVFAADVHDGNPTPVFLEIYRTMNVSAEEFWSRQRNVIPITETKKSEEPVAVAVHPSMQQPEPKKPSKPPVRGKTNAVLDLLIRTGQAMSAARIGKELGFTSQETSSALYHLHKTGMAKRVKYGVYESSVTRRPDHTIGIEVSQQQPKPEPKPEPVEVTPPPAPIQKPVVQLDDLDTVLELVIDGLFPNGIKGKHFAAVMKWREATIDLFSQVGES